MNKNPDKGQNGIKKGKNMIFMTSRKTKEYNGRNVDETAVLSVDDLPMPANFDGLDPAEANKTRARFEHSRRIYEMLFGSKNPTTGISGKTAQKRNLEQ